MKSITIHGLDSDLSARLERQARETGLSLNKTIKKILAAALGLGRPGQVDRRSHFEDLCGGWTKEEAAAFRAALRDFERVEPEDWR